MHTTLKKLLVFLAIGGALGAPATAAATAADPSNSNAASASYAGHYRLSDGGDLHVFQLRDRYHAGFNNGHAVGIEEIARGRFKSRHGDVELDFCADADSCHAGLLVTRRGVAGERFAIQPAGRRAAP